MRAEESEAILGYLFNNSRLYDLAPKLWSIILFSLTSLAFLLSDWIIWYLSFGDFILVLTVLLFMLLGQVRITKPQMKYISIVVFSLMLNFILNNNFNEYWFDTTMAVRLSIKTLFYILALVLVYNFTYSKMLGNRFLKVTNVFAITSVIVGLVISILIYFEYENI